MKTIEELIKEIEGSAALQDELKAIKDKDAFISFLKKNDFDGTVEDFGKAIQAKAGAEGAISDEAAEAVAGGFGNTYCITYSGGGFRDTSRPLKTTPTITIR